MVTIRTDKGAGGGHGTVGERVAAEFTSQEQHLRSLRWLDAPVSEISSTIKQYLSALCRNRSIALSRGETLSSTRLSRRLENVFTTAAPKVIAGPPISWTSLVLSVGPFYTGTGQLRIGESEIRLSKDDFDLLRSGRAWRFLSPWPGADDCLTELQAIETSMEELLSLKQSLTIGKPQNETASSRNRLKPAVMENISSVEYQLLHRRNAVTQRAQNMSTIRKPVEPSRQCPRNPEDAVSRCEADSSHLDEKSPLRESQVTPLSVENLREPYNRDLSISALTQGSSPSEPASDTVGLWGATYFIQNLCRLVKCW